MLFFKNCGAILFLIVIIAILGFLAGLRVDYDAQGYVSALLLALLLIFRQTKTGNFARVLFLTLSGFIVLRYFFWRINYTLSYQDLFSFIGAATLFAAELYGGLMFFLSAFVNIRPFDRTPVALPNDKALWPTVDVVIPSYDEPVELVKITLAAARNIVYPDDKINIYLLDDGGTQQKLNAEDMRARIAARLRRNQLLSVCMELGITYLSREQNVNAKAGNLNDALSRLSGDLILVLDADHAPATDILEKTVGSFVQDEKVFLVQTPHFFINPDPIEKNLGLFYRMPSENFMFYRAIQRGLDFWQSSFFCGSAAVLRRRAIDEAEGFSGMTVTEDSETALLLHSKGWRSHYLMYPLISGLQPETFTSFMVQRMRWAQGMVQNFILHNPLLLPKLKIWQRLSYLSNMLFWFFPFARIVFLVSPGLYLVFGLKIYNANIIEFFSYTVPYLLALVLTNHYLFSQVRWAFVSEIYETMQSLFSVRAVAAVLKNPHFPQFSVTPKMETLDRDFISPLVVPFYWSIVVTVLAASLGVYRFIVFPDERSLITITLFWSLFNLLLLLAALGALYEQKQRRLNPRIPVCMEAQWLFKPVAGAEIQSAAVTLRDLSMGGCNLWSKQALFVPDLGSRACHLEVPTNSGLMRFRVAIVNQFRESEHFVYGAKFLHTTTKEYLNIVRFVYGDSSRWMEMQQETVHNPGLIRTMTFIVRIGVSHGFNHILNVVKSKFYRLSGACRSL